MGSGGITRPPEASLAYSDESSHSSSPVNERVLKDVFGDDDEMFKEILTDFIAPLSKFIPDQRLG